MPEIRFQVDLSRWNSAAKEFPSLAKSLPYVTARSMTVAGHTVKKKIISDIYPEIEGGPTRWTQGGLISSKATIDNLKTQVGFKFGTGRFEDQRGARSGGSGVPAGEYMSTNVEGTTNRKAKSTERTLHQRGFIKSTDRLLPNPRQLKNKNGNVSGATIKSIIDKLQTPAGLEAAKHERAWKDSKRKKQPSKKQKRIGVYSDYFVMRMSGNKMVNRYSTVGEPRFIAKRVGEGKRQIVSVMNIIKRASYKRRFPIDKLALKEYQRQFDVSFKDGLTKEILRRIERGIK